MLGWPRTWTLPAVQAGLAIAVMMGASSEPRAETPFITKTPEQIQEETQQGNIPTQTILFGNPSKPGLYVVRVHFPAGKHSNPHSHSQDRQITVIKGTWWMGTGNTLDFNKSVPLKAGSYAYHPAGGIHWDGAGPDEDATVQIIGIGPVTTDAVPLPAESPGYWPQPK